jgi:hypothetical protein
MSPNLWSTTLKFKEQVVYNLVNVGVRKKPKNRTELNRIKKIEP